MTMQEGFKPREIEILRLMAEGLTNREIAEQLYIGIETVRWYAKQIYSKLHVSGREEAAKKAQSLGLLDEQLLLEQATAKPKHNLPSQLTSFIGREKQIAEITSLLSETRLLTLTGPGGTGKTRLSLKVAEQVEDNFADGVYFIDLAPLSDPEQVPKAIATSLSVIENTNEPMLETLKRGIGQREILLILDNYEHVIASAPLIADLLVATTNLRVLATSREALRVSGEQIYAVPAMTLSKVESEAVWLFVQRSQAVKRHFQLDRSNTQSVLEICQRLDGMPLAIELAAAQSRFLTPDVILQRIDNRFQTLKSGSRDAPQRQQTLQDTIDWSYDLLDEGEKLLFARLAVFRGGRSLEAIEAICSDDLPIDVFDGLASLVDKSMIRQIKDELGAPRFVMLETIQAYALEHLEASDEASQIRRQHAAYFADLAERACPELELAHQQEWYRRLETEHANIRAALVWSLSDNGVPKFGCRIVASLSGFWRYQSHHIECLRWTDHALEFIEDIPRKLRGQLLLKAGDAAYIIRQNLQDSRLLGQQALIISREIGDQYMIAHSLLLLGLSWVEEMDKYDEAVSYFEEAVALLRESGDESEIAIILNATGVGLELMGYHEQATRNYEESLSLCRKIGNRRREAILLGNFAHLCLEKDQYTEALTMLNTSVMLLVELDFRYHLSHMLIRYAVLWAIDNQAKRAARLLGALAAYQNTTGITFQLPSQRIFDRSESMIREQLDMATFKAEFEAGRTMSLDEAVAFALREIAEQHNP